MEDQGQIWPLPSRQVQHISHYSVHKCIASPCGRPKLIMLFVQLLVEVKMI
jgi:hypothetical protein